MAPFLNIGSLHIPLYSLCIFVGAVFFILTMLWQLKLTKARIYLGGFIVSFVAGVFFFIFGAALWDNIAHAIDGQQFGTAGISFLGGVVLGMPLYIMLLVLIYREKIALRIILNSIVPAIVIAHAFGRIGCFFGGCCYGKPSNWFWGVVYPEGSKAAEMYGYGTKLIPTQLIEATFLVGLYFVFLFLLKNRRVMWYCLIYGVYRFAAEFLRGDSRGKITDWLTPSQFLSIILVLCALGIFLYQHFKKDDGKIPVEGYIIKSKLSIASTSNNSLFVVGKEEKIEESKNKESNDSNKEE